MNATWRTKFWLTAVLVSLAVPAAWAGGTAGSLDTGFGSGGVVETDFGDFDEDDDIAFGAVCQADGKVIVSGLARFGQFEDDVTDDRFTLTRYRTDGSLDPSFGVDGIATVAFDEADADRTTGSATAVTIDASGQIVVVGVATLWEYRTVTSGKGKNKTTEIVSHYLESRVAVVRLDSDGSLDSSFDNDGIRIIDVSGCTNEVGRSIVVLADGDVLVGGGGTFTSASSGGKKGRRGGGSTLSGGGFLIRLDSTGGLDTGFGNDGVVIDDPGSGDDAFVIHGVAVQAVEGRIVALNFDSAVRGFDLATGASEGTFYDAPTDDRYNRLAVDDNDEAVVVCGDRLGDGLVTRLLANGAHDWDHVLDLAADFSFNAVGVDAQGRVVAGGNDGDAFALRLDDSGLPDLSFGSDGTSDPATPGSADKHVLDLALDGDDIILVGRSMTDPVLEDYWFAVRYCGATSE